jgi:hypothetical protein
VNFRQWLKDFTSDLNQPAFKAVIAAILSIGTGFFYWVCILFEKEIQETVWGLWLGFLATLWGVTYFDYRTKRQTTFERHEADSGANPQEHEPPPPKEQGDPS